MYSIRAMVYIRVFNGFLRHLFEIFTHDFFYLYLNPSPCSLFANKTHCCVTSSFVLLWYSFVYPTRDSTFPAPSITSAKIPPRPQLPPDIPTDAHLPFLLGFSANSKISLARTYLSHLHRLRCLEFTRSSDKLFILLVTYLSFHTITECESSHKSLFSRLQRVVHLHLTPAPGGSFPLLDLAKEILPL